MGSKRGGTDSSKGRCCCPQREGGLRENEGTRDPWDVLLDTASSRGNIGSKVYLRFLFHPVNGRHQGLSSREAFRLEVNPAHAMAECTLGLLGADFLPS